MRIGFVGLGVMGMPMATNLARAGHRVSGYNRSPEKTKRFAAAGGIAASSVADAVYDADVVITALPDSPDVEEVVLGADGVFASAPNGTLLIDTSTISPATARHVAAAAVDVGMRAVDAPVSGGEQGASNATLSIMVGGEIDDARRARPILSILGTSIVHVGPSGAGQTLKAANQLIVAGGLQLVAEALTFLKAHGVDLPAAVQALSGGLAGSRILDLKGPTMIRHEFAPGFRIDLHHKDLGILLDAASAVDVVTPVGALVAQLMASAHARGHGHLDHSALLLGVEDLSGRRDASQSPVHPREVITS